MRITVLGLPGSGKSTLARNIAERLHIFYIHLDQLWLEGGGGHNSQTTPDPEQTHNYMLTKVLEAIQEESWVSDGVYGLVQPEIAKRAEIMIFLDIPLWQRLFNHTKRTLCSIGGRGEMTFRNNIQFFLEMTHSDLRNTSKIKAYVNAFGGQKVILRSRKEASKYLESLS